MSAPKAIEFGGTDEELEKYLLEFAGIIGGRAFRAPGAWIVRGGDWLSTNANSVPWRLRVSRGEAGRMAIQPSSGGFPWSRPKAARLAAFRGGQLGDYLEIRLRGGDPEKVDALRLAEPFAAFGSDPAAVTASFAWAMLGLVGSMAGALAAALPVSLALMNLTIGEVSARSAAVGAAGAIPLPSPAELGSIDTFSRLGCALLFAFPLAFFSGLVHAGALSAGEAWWRATRFGMASFLFQAAIGLFAFFPFMPLASILLAPLVPLGAQAGYSLVWARRRERVREGPPPRRGLAWAGILLVAAVASAFVPSAAGAEDFKDRLALFRDRWLLGHPAGKAVAAFYYRYTLYAADPLKQFYATSPETPSRVIRTAQVAPDAPELRARLAALHFAIVPGGDRPCDVTADRSSLASGSQRVNLGSEPLESQLDRLAAGSFRGGGLRVLMGLCWKTIYYAGPLVVLALSAGTFCLPVSLLFRRLPRRSALIVLGGCFAGTLALLAWTAVPPPGALEALAAMKASPGAGIAAALAHESAALRHEAAFRAFRLERPAALAEPLLKAAEDPDLRVRIWACGALGRTRDPRALEVLRGRLRDPEFFVRYRAAEGLGALGDPAAAPDLERMMREGTWYEGLYALEALRKAGRGRR